jgi:hypothetical protein
MQTNKVVTIARRPPTIPQYPHDIRHTLAWEPHEPFLFSLPSCCDAILPLVCVLAHLGEGFGFFALRG